MTRAAIIVTAAIMCAWAAWTVYHSGKVAERAIEVSRRAVYHLQSTARADSIISVRQGKRIADSTTSVLKQDSLKTEINRLQRVVKKYLTTDLRRQVAELKPDTAEAAVFVRYDSALIFRDALISGQDSLISELYADRKQTWQNFTAEISGLKDKVKLSEDYAHVLETDFAKQARDFRRTRRKERVIEAVIIVGIAILAL